MYKTILKVHPEAPEWTKAGMMRTRFTVRVSIFDLSQDGNRENLPGPPQNRFGFYSHMANYVWMKNVRIVNNKWYGFDPHGANTAWSYYLVIEDCISAFNGKDGYTIDQYYYVSILNSVAYKNDRHGINVVSGSRYVLVKNNRLNDNPMCSIVVQNNEFGTRSLRFVKNIGEGHGIAGICIRNTFDVEVFYNKMYSTNRKANMYQLHEVNGVKLLANEWVRTPGQTMFSGYGDNEYTQWRTTVIDVTSAVRARYLKYVANLDKAPLGLVNLRNNAYGRKKADNHVPKYPRKLLFRNGKTYKKLLPRKSTHKQFIDPKGNNPQDSDPKCERGIRNGLFCCPEKCGSCAPANCATKGSECCPQSIRNDASSCDTFGPPCYLSRKYTARGRLYGPENLRKDGVFPENEDIKTTPDSARPKDGDVKKEDKPAVEPEPMPEPMKSMEPEMPKPIDVDPPKKKPVEMDPQIVAEKAKKEAMMEEMRKKAGMKPETEKKMKAEMVIHEDVDDEDDKEKKHNGKKKLILRKFTSMDSSSESEADPSCQRGVRKGIYCCPSSCGKCGGIGCSKRPGGKLCCTKSVRKENRSCADTGAPCMIRG